MNVKPYEPWNFILFFCFLMRSCQTLKNDATEILYSHVSSPVEDVPSNASMNRARGGGRDLGNTAHERNERNRDVGCRELRSTKYISDGQCTSISPIKELVCTGECLPTPVLPNWIGGYGRKFWSRQSGSQDWRCVNDKMRTQRIQLQCQDGSARTYKITVVTSCKCKRYSRQHNDSANKFEGISRPQLIHRAKSKRRHGKSKLNGNWHETES